MSEDYGNRLLVKVLHQEAKKNPERTFAIVAKSNNVEDGFYNVSFHQIARAVNFLSNWLQDALEDGAKPLRLETLTYIGVPDLCYAIFSYAAIQCQYKVFLPSPRNTIDVNVALLGKTECSKLVYSSEVAPTAKSLEASSSHLHTAQLPSLEELLSAPNLQYPYDFEYDQIYKDPCLIIHSSGSTGLPKPITFTHGTLSTYDVRDFPSVAGRVTHDGLGTLRFSDPNSCIYDIFPPFHVMGFMTKVLVPVYNPTIVIFGPPLRPPSGHLAAQILRQHKPRGAVLPPSIVEQLYHEPGSAELFKQLKILLFAGGPLPDSMGDDLSKYITLCQFYGSTEMHQIRQLIPNREDWAYMEFNPHEGFEFQPAADGLYELVAYTGPERAKYSALYHNFPDTREWRTKDLFEPHPTKQGLWKYCARNDDILVFSSGEKLNPLPLESAMTAVPHVRGALLVGQRHPQSALIIELDRDVTCPSEDLTALWPEIENANALLPAHGRVSKSMVIFSDPQKPFLRAGKGTVIRRMTEKLYTEEIQGLFHRKLAAAKVRMISSRPSGFQIADVEAFLRSILENISVSNEIGVYENLYSYGMDSVRTAEAIGYIKGSLRSLDPNKDLNWLSLDTMYLNPTISQLSSVLLDYVNEGAIPKDRDRISEMGAKVDEYTRQLSTTLPPRTEKKEGQGYSVAVTGTTGYLGSHMLRRLIDNPEVSRIYCLNRSLAAREQFDKLELSHNVDMVFFSVNFDYPELGLKDEEYARLLGDCDLFLHNAWKVDFNLPLDSFDDNIASVRSLIDLSTQSPLRPRILFISSVSATGVFGVEGSCRQTIPENIVSDLGTAMSTGYAESKRVSEHILEAAATVSKIPITVIRMGQISPNYGEAWPENDLLPVFMRTCKASGLVASDFLDTVDWLPIDSAAEIVNDLVLHRLGNDESSIQVFNVVNPQEQKWTNLLNTVQNWCGDKTAAVSTEQWVESLKTKDTGDTIAMTEFPALRILPSFEQMTKHGSSHKFSVEKLMVVSPSANEVPAIDERLLSSWLDQM